MTQKKIIIEFTFEEKKYDDWDDETYLDLVSIERTRSDLSPLELNRLGESVAQSHRWQIDRWIDIQNALSNPDNPSVRYDA